ncbi:MAG: hypothetical protein S4CHLAM102_09450 [Chlamydiia bacterium]|nr:hypothetical protein [Chlamydiia bacterium]
MISKPGIYGTQKSPGYPLMSKILLLLISNKFCVQVVNSIAFISVIIYFIYTHLGLMYNNVVMCM